MTNDLPYSGWSNAALIATISAHRQQLSEFLLKSELQAAEIERLNKANTELARKLAEVLRRQAASGEIVRLNLAALSEEQREKVYELIDLIKLVADGSASGAGEAFASS